MKRKSRTQKKPVAPWARRWFDEAYGERGLLVFDGLDEAIIGVVSRYGMEEVTLYDHEKAVRCFQRQGMSREDAEEWMSFNVTGAWIGDKTPAFAVLTPREPKGEKR